MKNYNNMRALILIVLIGLLSNLGYSQKPPSISDVHNIYDEKGDYYFGKTELKKAIVYYNMAYAKDANNYYSVLKKAEVYTALGLLDQAIQCYKIIFATDLFIPNDYRLKFAKILLENKDIKGFEKWMAAYNEIVDTEISGYVSSTATRAKMYKDSSIVMVENESFLNTAESEISPAIHNDQFVFASTRKNLTGTKSSGNYSFFKVDYLPDGQLGRLNKYNKSLTTGQNESSIVFNDIINSVYFTRSNSLRSGLKTFEADIPTDISSKPNLYELTIEGFSGSIGHVTFNSKGTVMYFVSDAPGGVGGLDIYSSELVSGEWSKPVNVAAVNTSKDEIYPYLVNDAVLYFSSEGHGGLGGFDLFALDLDVENATPRNLGNKVNSNYDDYGLAFSPGGLTGYFCSNRPGGFGKEDIYRLQLLDLKIKYAAYRHKRSYSIEEGKINLYLSDGEEHNIASADKSGFSFSFRPEVPYKMVIQRENPIADNIINNDKLSDAQKKKEFLRPKPLQKSEVKLTAGMKYEFTAGMKPLSNQYKSELKSMSGEYQGGSSNIDLTALAKELMLAEGEVYTIQFVKDDSQYAESSKEESSLYINNQEISVNDRAFFFVLPLDIQVNFNIKTDIAYFKDNYNPKKVGAVKIDDAPIIKEEVEEEFEGFPILVNTDSYSDLGKSEKISAKELTIIPGSVYILTLTKTDEKTGKKLEIVVPLTKGVQYNLGTETQSKDEYNKTLSKMMAGQSTNANEDEELIDISILSKELDMLAGDNVVFDLVPAQSFGSQSAGGREVLTTLKVDGRKFYVTDKVKLLVNLKLDETKKVNIQTDLAYVQENFVASTINLELDTASFTSEIITDPVYDVVVVNFDLNQYDIRPDAKSIMDSKVVNELKNDSRLYVTIKGYTDGLGDAAHNEELSGNRAHSVKDYLASKGIGENRIRTFSFGESMSLGRGIKWEDLSEAELQEHRKVEIVIYLPEEK